MTKKKLESIAKKYIIPSLGNYKLHGEFIIKLPIKDIVTGFCLERSSVLDCGYAWWFSQPLYVPYDLLHLTFGGRIEFGDGGQLWNFTKEQIEQTMNLLTFKMKGLQKKLALVEEPIDFYNYFKGEKENNLRIYEAVTYSACWTMQPSMQRDIEECINFILKEQNLSIPWIKTVLDNLRSIEALKDNEQIFYSLNKLKIAALSKLKLE